MIPAPALLHPTAFYYLAATGDILRACGKPLAKLGRLKTMALAVALLQLAPPPPMPARGRRVLSRRLCPFGQPTQPTLNRQKASLAQVPGMAEVVMTAIDATGLNSGGIEWLNNRTGTLGDAYEVYQSTNPSGAPTSPASSARPDTTFGKAGGIGDLEALCDPAPLEIGNRVWNDVNGNGVQDPGEPALAGGSSA